MIIRLLKTVIALSELVSMQSRLRAVEKDMDDMLEWRNVAERKVDPTKLIDIGVRLFDVYERFSKPSIGGEYFPRAVKPMPCPEYDLEKVKADAKKYQDEQDVRNKKILADALKEAFSEIFPKGAKIAQKETSDVG